MIFRFVKSFRSFCSKSPESHISGIFNRRNILFSTFFGCLSYNLYYTYKKNNSINIKLFPPGPLEGIVVDREKLEYLNEKYGKYIKNNYGKVKYLCFYGKLGCGKSLLTKEFCKVVNPERNRFLPPESNVVSFANCSSIDALEYSIMDLCEKLSDASENSFDPYIPELLNLDIEERLDKMFAYIRSVFQEFKIEFTIVLDNINEDSYKEFEFVFKKYFFSDYFRDLSGTFILLCDTNESIADKDILSFRINGLTINTAFKLFLKYSKISESSLKITDPDIRSIIQLIHSQPLSVISFACMVRNHLETNQMSIKSAIRHIEQLVLDRVKERIQSKNINLLPGNFEMLFVQTLLEMALREVDNQPFMSVLSLFDPLIPLPETLLKKVCVNLSVNLTLPEVPTKDTNQTREKNETLINKIKHYYEEQIEMYNEALKYYNSLYGPQLASAIDYQEKIDPFFKLSPFINVIKGTNQNLIMLHPLVHKQFRTNFLESYQELFSQFSLSNPRSFAKLFSYFTSTPPSELITSWIRTNLGLSSSSTDLNDTKISQLTSILYEVNNALAHNDPVRFSDRQHLCYLRLKQANSFLLEFKSIFKEENLQLSYDEKKLIVGLMCTISSLYSLLEMYKNSEAICIDCMNIMNIKLNKEKSPFRPEILLLYLTLAESYIRQNEADKAYPYLKNLYKIAQPNIPSSEPYVSVKLLILISEFHKISKKRVTKLDDVDLLCHAIQKLSILCLQPVVLPDQLPEDALSLYLAYIKQLIRNNYLDYADFVIKSSEDFYSGVILRNNFQIKSHFDSKLLDVKMLLEAVKGNTDAFKSLYT